jgi:hypothetical protein
MINRSLLKLRDAEKSLTQEDIDDVRLREITNLLSVARSLPQESPMHNDVWAALQTIQNLSLPSFNDGRPMEPIMADAIIAQQKDRAAKYQKSYDAFLKDQEWLKQYREDIEERTLSSETPLFDRQNTVKEGIASVDVQLDKLIRRAKRLQIESLLMKVMYSLRVSRRMQTGSACNPW